MALKATTKSRRPPPRIILYGPPKIGKTTAALKVRRPVFLPTEDGLANLDVLRIANEHTGKLEHWEELREATHAATMQPLDESATLVNDTVTSSQDLCFAEVARRHRVPSITDIPYGKGFAPALVLWIEWLKQLDYARSRGKAVIMLGHSHVENYPNPEGEPYQRHSLRLHQQADGKPSIRANTMEWADALLFVNMRAVLKESGSGFNERTIVGANAQRIIYTQPSPLRAAGSRYALPPEIPFDMALLSQHLAAAFALPQATHVEQAEQQAPAVTPEPKQQEEKVDLNEMLDPATLSPYQPQPTQTQEVSSTEQAS